MKKIVLILLVFGLILAATGCTSESASNHSRVQATLTEDYQDSDWQLNRDRYAKLIMLDLKSISDLSSNGDFNALIESGEDLVDDTQRAIYDNNKYAVSPKYKEAQNEWKLAMQDYNSAGKSILKAGTEALNNTDATADMDQYTAYLKSGNQHADRSKVLIEAAAQ